MSAIKNAIKGAENTIKMLKATEEANKAFRKLSPAEKRVAIANDVIAALKSKQYIAAPGTYLRFDDSETCSDEPKSEDLQCALALGQECNVCALGGLFTSAVRFKNDVSSRDAEQKDQTAMRRYLDGIFTEHQLALVETAFELDSVFALDAGVNHDLAQKAQDFGDRYYADDKRMIAIMKNIIKNNGTFIP